MTTATSVTNREDRLEDPDPRFRVAGEFAVRAILRELMVQATPMTLHPEGRRDDPVPARVTDVDSASLELEVPGLSQDAARLLAAGFVIASTAPATVRTRFRIERLRPGDEALDGPAGPERIRLRAPLPPAAWRYQRRDSFRVRPPGEDEAHCVQRIAAGRERRYTILDLSAGGLCLELAHGQPLPEPGTLWSHCRIEAAAVVIPCELMVCGIHEGHAAAPDDAVHRPRGRVALAFHRMPAEVLRAVQRYVIDIERRTRASARE